MVRAFIHALGGPRAVAERLRAKGHDVSEDNVSLWGTRNHIPHKHRLQLARLARSEGVGIESAPQEIRAFFPIASEIPPTAAE